MFGGLAETFGRIYSANLAETFGRIFGFGRTLDHENNIAGALESKYNFLHENS